MKNEPNSIGYFEKHPRHRVAPPAQPAAAETLVEDDRTGMSEETIKRAMLDNLFFIQGVSRDRASLYDYYMALSYTIRDRLIHRWIKSSEAIGNESAKVVCYLSAEFLMGRQLGNNLLNVNCFRQARHALNALDLSIYDILEQEPEPALGNGGLGRLAACFLDSLATLSVPAIGYGIRYEFGIFRQSIWNGWQIEHPDKWLVWGNPWEIARPQKSVAVKLGGHTEWYKNEQGGARKRWVPARVVLGTPYDTMVPGYGTDMVNTLRLWSAGTTNDFDFGIFNAGDYNRAVEEKTASESISKVLYPNDNTPQGRELRLKQQYFFVSCSIQDVMRRLLSRSIPLSSLPDRVAIQMNDTHPAVAVAELMRLLVDEHDFPWDQAWEMTVSTLGYTNHTLLSEALERWPVGLFAYLLPRHLEIILEINQRFLSDFNRRCPGDGDRAARMSIIEEGPVQKIRMANLATIGSHSVNGVAALHSELVKRDLLGDFYHLWPEKFNNKTNGVTPRRWMMLANPKLTYLISDRIGKGWLKDITELRKLEAAAEDPGFRETWKIFKSETKRSLADYIHEFNQVKVDHDSLFDVQVKRLHEYKRQLLNAIYIVTLYNRIKANPGIEMTPRTFIFGAKAAPGYFMAKLIIKLINSLADVINNDPAIEGRMKVVFLANFCVSLGERVYPAADLSEQISMAGKEASGTGNMKFSLNGALTIGTLDGANVEIRECVGEENFFLFGHTVDQINEIRSRGYNPRSYYERDEELRGALAALSGGVFSGGDSNLFRPIVENLLGPDEYFLMADYRSYVNCQERVSETFRDSDAWTRMAILNVARMGYFSSDRTIKEYCDEIWHARPVKVKLERSEAPAIETRYQTKD